MESTDDYNYLAVTPIIKKFKNLYNENFIEEPKDYNNLWKFKECVKSWTLGLCRHKNCFFLMHKKEISPTYLPLNMLEKLTITSPHNNNYLVLTMQVVNVDGTNMYHLHSIVVKVGSKEA
jgi:hypothetical protein